MTARAKSRPPFLNSRYADFFIKWMSRINTWMYKRNKARVSAGPSRTSPNVDYATHFPEHYEDEHTAGLRLLRVFARVRD